MKRRGIALGVGLLVALMGVIPSLAHSIAVTNPDDLPLQHEPVLVSAFSAGGTKKAIEFIELNNHTSDPVNLAGWKIQVSFGGDVQTVNLPSGWLLEDEYQTIGISTVVGADVTQTLASQNDLTSLAVIDPTGVVRQFIPTSSIDATKWYQRSTGTASMKNNFEDFAAKTITSASPKVVRSTGPLYQAPPTVPAVQIVEIYPYASDCSPHDQGVLCGDYVKFYNPTTQVIDLSEYVLRTDSSSSSRTSSNTFLLDGFTIQPGEYKTKWTNDDGGRISLTNSGGYIWLEDVIGVKTYVDATASYPSAGSSQQGFAWAQQDSGEWAWTSAPTPLSANVFPVVASVQVDVLAECPAGKYRNPETNRCRTIEEAVNALATCPEGQYRNPETNRCKASATLAVASLVPCKEGQERNPATNRCRSIASAVAELIPCDEGYERNPATNRCRKSLLASNNPATNLASVEQAGSSSAALPWVLGIVALGAIGYGAYEWRHELLAGGTKLLSRFKK